MLAAPDNIGGS